VLLYHASINTWVFIMSGMNVANTLPQVEVWHSTNDGTSWTLVQTSSTFGIMNAASLINFNTAYGGIPTNEIICGVVFQGASDTLVSGAYSDDHGITWRESGFFPGGSLADTVAFNASHRRFVAIQLTGANKYGYFGAPCSHGRRLIP
jgi:hypothetical protein